MTAEELRAARSDLGMTQHGLADALGMGRWGFQTVGKWERGEAPISKRAEAAIKLLIDAGTFPTEREQP